MPVAAPGPNGLQREEEWFKLSRGSMLVLYRGDGAFVVDLEKGVMDKVMDFSPCQFIDRFARYTRVLSWWSVHRIVYTCNFR